MSLEVRDLLEQVRTKGICDLGGRLGTQARIASEAAELAGELTDSYVLLAARPWTSERGKPRVESLRLIELAICL